MRSTHPARVAVMLLALPLFAGCTSQVTAPVGGMTAQTADDVAIQAVAGMTVMGGDVQFAISTTPPAGPASAHRVATTARLVRPAQAMWDTSFTMSGVTYQASRTFYDALDTALPGWTPLAVRLRWTSRAFGTFQGPRDTASVGHDALLDVRGIQTGQDTLTFDGVCHDTLQNSFRSLDGTRNRYFLWLSTTQVDGVHILKSTLQAGGYPIDGTVTFTASADRLRSNNISDVEAHYEAFVVVTFNGTAIPEIVVNSVFHYHWNMVTGVITRG